MCNFDHFMYFALLKIFKNIFLFTFSFTMFLLCNFNNKGHFHGQKIYIFVFKNDLCYYFINFPFNFCTYFTVFNSFYAK